MKGPQTTARQPSLDHVRKRSYIPHMVVDGSSDACASGKGSLGQWSSRPGLSYSELSPECIGAV